MEAETIHEPGCEKWIGRAILHVDLDAFFAAVEQLDTPEWRGRPVIVGGSPDARGVVSTASYEARAFGVHSAMSSARAKQLCPDAVWARPRFERYKEISGLVMDIFRSMTPCVQPVSIDEAFLDVSAGPHTTVDPLQIAEETRRQVALLGVTCSVGIGTSKTVAKIASDFHKPNGVTVVAPGEEYAFLSLLPIEVMSGIGPQAKRRLNTLGIRTLGDLSALDDVTATQLLGSGGPLLTRRARGEDTEVVHAREPMKSISGERTFAEDLRDSADIHDAVKQLSARVGRRLRKKKLVGRTVYVKVKFSDFSTRTAQRTLDGAVDRDDEIVREVISLVSGIWHPGVGIRLLGVGVSGLENPARQMNLFSADSTISCEDDERRRQISNSVDAVRERFGDDAISFGPPQKDRSDARLSKDPADE